ncbi:MULTISPECIES: VOC family protein [Streptomyces]|uniref:VOC family protein n=1 Tax=Streptomyces TaxID=1883 RepID=UPI0022490C35|nr:VOC family protein [Streptomyces sp. JHD 1]MCX2970105.1 VOC family protein [Streptomyces sp. JHD 1]
MAIKRSFANILSDRLPETRDFFSELLGLTVVYDSDWFVSLQDPDDPRHELGVWRRDHELVPEPYRTAPSGTVLTFVVDDVDAVHRAAREQGREIVAPPRDTFYGQRSMLVKDPNGQLLDVCTPVAG